MDNYHCYICHPESWKNPDFQPVVPYYIGDIDNYDIFIKALRTENCNLEEMIWLGNKFNLLYDTMANQINESHIRDCKHKCSQCKQEVKKAKTSIADDICYDLAFQKIFDISQSQLSDLKKLSRCNDVFRKINNMVGMKEIKKSFTETAKFLLGRGETAPDLMLNTRIYGPPGHGKTEIARLLGKAYVESGLLSNENFIIATRTDLIGKYCGHTEAKTLEMFDKARGGVILIDEIYELGNQDKGNVFTGECINTINRLLTERKDTLCIIAGYEEETESCFFSYNKGLKSRFPFVFRIDKYTSEELCLIFYKLAKDSGWDVEPGALKSQDLEMYKLQNGGRDIEHILTKSIIAHYQNSFLKPGVSKELSRIDTLTGLRNYIKTLGNDDDQGPSSHHMMYT
jgi:hypothetical protein